MEAFVTLTKSLLKEEHQAEIDECSSLKKNLPLSELQSRGICIKKVHIFSMKTGLYGRTIVKLGLRGAKDKPLPSHGFSSGDIVDLHLKTAENFSKPELSGVVISVKETVIDVALDGDGVRARAEELLSSDQSMILFKTANEVTYRRLQNALHSLLHYEGGTSSLVEICFGEVNPTCYSQPVKVEKYYNQSLNESQKRAIEFALTQRELAIIHGPPGTGKTTTVAELVAQLVTNGQKVLACAPSNVAIDNILEKLSAYSINRRKSQEGPVSRIKLLRLGHPARILSSDLQSMSLDAMIVKSDSAQIVQDVRKDIDSLYINFRKTRKRDVIKFREEKKILNQELREREKKAITEILTSADVILSTNVGAHLGGPLRHLPKDHFDVVVIDECGQALEASCWIPMLQAPKAVLAGDHLQLPPTVKSHDAAAKWLSKSLLERITKLHSQAVRMLTIQYRMNTNIMKWSSDIFYDSKLVAHESVRDHTLKDLPGVDEDENTTTSMLLIDTAGCDMPELQTIDNESIGNPGEAEIVAHHVSSLIDGAGVDPKHIAVISPYNMQVDILRKLLQSKYKGLEIRSVDGFQGREKEAVVISLVRSNEKGIVGFLSDDRRTNVAVTRARRHLALVCDSLTIGKHKFLKTLLDHICENGDVKSAYEFMNTYDNDSNSHFDAMAFCQDFAVKKSPFKRKTATKENEKLEKLRGDLRKIVTEFLKNAAEGTAFHEFPSSLTSRERLVVHELCEELGLSHESIGEGNDRRIVISTKSGGVKSETLSPERLAPSTRTSVRKSEGYFMNTLSAVKDGAAGDLLNPLPDLSCGGTETLEKGPVESNVCANGNSEDNPPIIAQNHLLESTRESEKSVTEIETASDHQQVSGICSTLENDQPAANLDTKQVGRSDTEPVLCPICGSKVPPENLQLHKVHCKRLKTMKDKLELKSTEKSTSKVETKKAPKSKKKKPRTKTQKVQEENDDELLDAAIQANKKCPVPDCGCAITFFGQWCPFCKKTFCSEHQMPELHGCAEAVRQWSKRHNTSKGNGPSALKQRANLHRKLDSRLKDLESKRRSTNRR